MKKPYLAGITLLLIIPFVSNAQWAATGTNIYNTNTGSVGIGTGSPIAALDVSGGGVHVQGGFGASYIIDGAYIAWNKSGGGGETNFINNIGGGGLGGFTFENNTRSNVLTRLMTITNTGFVGIGTTGPLARLHNAGNFITAGGSANIDGININYLANSAQMLVGWNRSGGKGEIDFISNQGGGSNGGFAFYNHNNSNVETQLIYINGDGNVGINTGDTQGYKLAVNGSAIATSMTVKLYTDWPDYVFKPNYKLPSLTEVKTYIDKNQHLPEVPSEQEIIKNGLNLGEMNKLLVKKVEELTLYLIEQNKRIEDLQQKQKIDQTQQSQIDELRKQVKTLIKKKS